MLLAIWVISVLVIGLVFSVVANERRREIAVLRALGSTSFFVFRSLLAEATLLALAGGVVGTMLAGGWIFLLRGLMVDLLGISFLLPSPFDFLLVAGASLALAVASVLLAALFPAYRVSRLDPALAMRE
ncbi:MAG TPA: FtsX-like permease family protein [Chloroflexota bacterium]|nr:FtsX-like permease family protein [Chloroflexota bacterium]